MTTLDELSLKQIESIEARMMDGHRKISSAITEYGSISWTDDGNGQGEVWSADVVRINARDHVLIGSYTKTYEWGENAEGLWRPDPQKPFVSVFGYPGFARLARMNGLGPTDNARMKLGRALGAVMGGWPDRG